MTIRVKLIAVFMTAALIGYSAVHETKWGDGCAPPEVVSTR